MHKIRTSDSQMLSDMISCARINKSSEVLINSEMNDLDISKYIPLLPDRAKQVEVQINEGESMMPCLRRLWNMDVPPSGMAHQLCHMMSRWCFKSGLSKYEAIGLFDGHIFWKDVKARDYEKVIESVYRTGNAFIGCRNGRDADLLTPHCEIICPFNRKFKVSGVFNKHKGRI